MKQPDNIPEKEWRSREGFLLHKAEREWRDAKRRQFWQKVRDLTVEVCAWVAVGCLGWLFVWACQQL